MKEKLKQEQQEKEATIEFRQARQNHLRMKSAIGALLTGNGQDRYRDRMDLGYKRYVALGILGRNLHTHGKLIWKEREHGQGRKAGLALPRTGRVRTRDGRLFSNSGESGYSQ